MKTQQDIDKVFRKAAFEDELPKNSVFDDAVFWDKLESNLTNQKPSNHRFWYLAAASVLLLVGFLLSWSVSRFGGFEIARRTVRYPENGTVPLRHTDRAILNPAQPEVAQLAKISPESKVVGEDTDHGISKVIHKSVAVREDTNHGILIKSRVVREDTNHGAALAIDSKVVREDTNPGYGGFEIRYPENGISNPAQLEDTNHGVETPTEKSTISEDINHELGLITQKQKNKKIVKLRIVHANELFENEPVVAQRQESEPPQRFIVINLKLPKSNPEQNLIALIRKK